MAVDPKIAYKHALVREEILQAVREDLIGPSCENEIINEKPSSSYITGILFPKDSAVTEDENFAQTQSLDDYPTVELGEESDADGETQEASFAETDDPDERNNSKGFQKPSSIGVSCYIEKTVSKIKADIKWGSYESEKTETEETDAEGKTKTVRRTVYKRTQNNESVVIDFSSMGRSATIPLKSNKNIIIYVINMMLKTGYRLITVYIHNKDKCDETEEDWQKTMFQTELSLLSMDNTDIFVPEYICRNRLSDEYYYEGRPVYAHGRQCAAIWEIKEGNLFASKIKSSFIPEYEISGVSANINELPDKIFSMLQFSNKNNKNLIISNLNQLSELYEQWINEKLVNSSRSFEQRGEIISKCKEALRRIKKGIELIERDEIVFKAFNFMNFTMQTQRAIAAYSRDKQLGKDNNLKDYTQLDNNEWRPFQIAFVLLNLYGILNPSSEEREIVDLLYFPTGGGKTEAYLGLIAFTIAYRRLTARAETEYEKDGGVTVILRYTLRLLTTQQRDRLLKLIIAMEMVREAQPNLYGEERISIGFWVGSGVTPNNFDEYKESDFYEKRKFEKKIKSQILKCPCCGKTLDDSNFKVIKQARTVKITCSTPKCYFGPSLTQGKEQRTIPVYLVDEEIYSKCPTVIISTVDKFARLPWTEKTGLIFGRTDKKCTRCGYLAVGEEHSDSHKRIAGEKDTPHKEPCKPFYPPELIIQDELHLITGPLGTIYGGYETVIEDLCCITRNGKKIHPKYIVSTATIKNADEQIKCLYARKKHAQFPPSGFDIRDSFFMKEINLPGTNVLSASESEIEQMISLKQKPFRKYASVCAAGQSVKTTLVRLYSIILQKVYELSKDPEFTNYVDPYYTLVGYFNSIRELGGAVRLLDDDISERIKILKKKHNFDSRRFIYNYKEITSRIPSTQISKILEMLATEYTPEAGDKQKCYDVAIATNMIAVGMDVDRLGLMVVTGQPKQNAEYIQATSRVGRQHPGLVFTVYNPYRPRDLSNYENFIGFHSQMYRYVEGTTATPFAARARDRDLHALIVSLIRLQINSMANNKDAININSLPDADIQNVKNTILERVKTVSPGSVKATEKDFDFIIDNWKQFASGQTLSYHQVDRYKDTYPRLMSMSGIDFFDKDKELETLTSMRDVEKSSAAFYWEEKE